MIKTTQRNISIIGGLTGTLVSPAGRSRGSLLWLFVCDPVLFWVIQGIDHFGNQLVGFSNVEHGTSIFMSATVIGGGEYGEELTSGESFETVHHALVSSDDVLGFVVVKELLDTVRSEFDNVTSAIRVTDEVRLDTKLCIVICRVAPKDINNQLLLGG